MWKKEEEKVEIRSPVRPRSPVEQLKDRAIIGSSIHVNGEVTGGEDLLVNGQVEGKIQLEQYNLTVAKSGRVKGDVFAKIISVEGQVQGNLFGEEKVVIRQSGTVRGNIAAPRVNMEEGSQFKGGIDMDSQGGQRKTGSGLKSGLKRNRELSLGGKAT